MAKITFLFGAGASANSLPVVAKMKGRLENFKTSFIEYRDRNPTQPVMHPVNFPEVERRLINELEILIKEVDNHASIDTYAKKLTITRNKEKILQLKVLLSFFFIFEQFINPCDSRYDSFFASILGNQANEFIGDIKILSWNYDFQFEKAYSAYMQSDDLSKLQIALNVLPSPSYKSLHEYGTVEEPKEGFGIYKLNGTTSFFNVSTKQYYNRFNSIIGESDNFFSQFTQEYHTITSLSHRWSSTVNFAWERKWNVLQVAKKAIIDTEVLVVIGYSIPFFNRSVDKELMAAISPSLKKIYIQSPNPNDITKKLSSIFPSDFNGKVKIEEIDAVSEFFLPPEL